MNGSTGGEKPVVNQALDSIMGMAVQMPALKRLGEELGLSMDAGLSGMAEGALTGGAPKPRTVEPKDDTPQA